MNTKKAFSLIEVVLVVTIGVILAGFAVISLSGKKNVTELNETARIMATTLREAQSNSAAQKESAGWGVLFDNANPTEAAFALFAESGGGGYATRTVKSLPSSIRYYDPTNPNSKEIRFSQISGEPSDTSFRVIIYLAGNETDSSTIRVMGNGAIAYDQLRCSVISGCFSTTVIIDGGGPQGEESSGENIDSGNNPGQGSQQFR